MSKFIISALRHHAELRGSLFLTAVELAHRASDTSGVARISYSYLADKAHCSPRTAIRHVQRLIDMKIIRCQRFQQYGKKWLVNLYQFLIKWDIPKSSAQMGSKSERLSSSDRMAENLPHPRNTEEKYGSMEGEKKAAEKVLSWLTPGSVLAKLIGGEA